MRDVLPCKGCNVEMEAYLLHDFCSALSLSCTHTQKPWAYNNCGHISRPYSTVNAGYLQQRMMNAYSISCIGLYTSNAQSIYPCLHVHALVFECKSNFMPIRASYIAIELYSQASYVYILLCYINKQASLQSNPTARKATNVSYTR